MRRHSTEDLFGVQVIAHIVDVNGEFCRYMQKFVFLFFLILTEFVAYQGRFATVKKSYLDIAFTISSAKATRNIMMSRSRQQIHPESQQ